MEVVKIKLQDPKKEKVKSIPYIIFNNYSIGDQDIWQGDPAFLLGFCKKQKTGKINLLFTEFWQEPRKAKGMYPVFMTIDKRIYTEKAKVIKISVGIRKTLEEIKEDHVQGDIQDQQRADAEELKNLEE